VGNDKRVVMAEGRNNAPLPALEKEGKPVCTHVKPTERDTNMIRKATAASCTILGLGMLLSILAQPAGPGPRPNPPERQTRPADGPRRPPLPEGTKAMRDIDYGGQGKKSQTLDLFVPGEAKDPLPVVVWIHGGAWLAGSKEGCPAIRFLTRGYAVASLNYRLTQEAIFPAQIEDCKGAIRWLRANAGKHGLDPNRIGVWGSSAGGHLVALLGTSGDVKELEGKVGGNLEFTSRVQAVCDWFGPTDFLKMIGQPSSMRHAAADSPESLLVGGAIEKMKEMVAKASPITYVGKGNPPFLIMHGDKDNLVPINQSEILYDALKKAGVEATFEVVKGAGHGFGGPEVNRKVEEFFDEHLKPAGATTKPAP